MELLQDLGQVWTPKNIAAEMAIMALDAMPNDAEILDPSCGPATFAKALRSVANRKFSLTCFDVDPRMVELTRQICDALEIYSSVFEQDYLCEEGISNKFDLIIMNPPYIRQEKIKGKDKQRYYSYIKSSLGVSLDKRSNLFVLFLLKGIIDLKVGGVMCAIVYDAITQTSYGEKALNIIENNMDIILSKKVKAPFNDVIVDAQILLLKKRGSPNRQGDVTADRQPSSIGTVSLENLLQTRRGTCFPLRALFLASEQEPYFQYSTPIFIKQASMSGLTVEADRFAYLVNEKRGGDENLIAWLRTKASVLGRPSVRINVPSVKGSILFNYYVRNQARHLWNPEKINASDNFYVSNSVGGFPSEAAWLLLNSDMYLQPIMDAGRSQGGGLKKLQLYEYKRAIVPDWRVLNVEEADLLVETARDLISNCESYEIVRRVASELAEKLFNNLVV